MTKIKIYQKLTIIFLFLLIIALSSCSRQSFSCLTIAPPSITLTGPKTSVERQIMGEYKEIEKDAWLVSSTRGTTDAGSYEQDNREIKIFRAMAVIEENKRKLFDYQQKGIIGETNTGFLIKASDELDREEQAKLDIENLIIQINNSRRIIYMALYQDVQGMDVSIEEIGQVFARKYQSEAPRGSRIQDPNGVWQRK